jgi:hypothetical protein
MDEYIFFDKGLAGLVCPQRMPHASKNLASAALKGIF